MFARDEHGVWVVPEPHHAHIIGGHGIDLGLLTHRCGVERRFHDEIVAESHVILTPCPDRGQECQYKDRYNSSVHVYITHFFVFYCISIPILCKKNIKNSFSDLTT